MFGDSIIEKTIIGNGELGIIALFSKGPSLEYTINQIAKLQGKSYASTNKYVHSLVEQEVLVTKTVGQAILCSLNFRSRKTLAALTFLSLFEGGEGDPSLILFSSGGKFSVGHSVKGFIRITETEFRQSLPRYLNPRTKVLSGHEKFWRLVAGCSG